MTIRRMFAILAPACAASILWWASVPAAIAEPCGEFLHCGTIDAGVEVAGSRPGMDAATEPGTGPTPTAPTLSAPQPTVVTTDCGSFLDPAPGAGQDCRRALDFCTPFSTKPARAIAPPYLHVTFNTLFPLDGTAPLNTVRCEVDTRVQRPALSTAAITQAVRRLLPAAPVGTPQPVSLVNFKVLLWLDTPAARTLGTVTLLGRKVQIRIALATARWDFGDQQSDTAHDPGTPYDPAQDCGACPDTFGHTYTAGPGPVTITATADWTAQFNVDGAGWTTLPAPVAGTPARTTIRLLQSRSVLIADPTG